MKHLAKSLASFKKYLDNTPREEVEALIVKIDKTDFGGPTIAEYLEQLDESLKMDSWLEVWPVSQQRPNGNWGFEKLTKVRFHYNAVVHPSPARLESDDDFVETSICEAA